MSAHAYDTRPSGLLVRKSSGQIVRPRQSPWIPAPAIEEIFPWLEKIDRRRIGDLLLKPVKERIAVLMAGSWGNYSVTQAFNLFYGKTAWAGDTTYWVGLWTAALDDTSHGGTANEAAYTSYGRLSLTNNTTIFAAGSGTTTRVNTFPSDATKSFVASSGGSATVTYLMLLNGNALSSADKNMLWCSVTSTAIASGDTPQLAQNAVSTTGD